jgi:hypothetical protein
MEDRIDVLVLRNESEDEDCGVGAGSDAAPGKAEDVRGSAAEAELMAQKRAASSFMSKQGNGFGRF